MAEMYSGKAVLKKRPEHDASALEPVKNKKESEGKGDNSRPANLNAGNKLNPGNE